ncbi:DUF1402 family protein [Mesorhizobium sp. KR1-2]|uniref:DUF1402 family protein n=1 Tax=Mesorhizobium sp. KR1-2 TaxID=3156609 RepID=UPI0032B3A76F
MKAWNRLGVAVAVVAALSTGVWLAGAARADRMVVVPAGNRSAAQPPIPTTSALRARAFNTTYDAKYAQIIALLKRETKLMAQIKKAATAYGIDPIHIVGALVGEHTYNVSAVGTMQTYYVKALAYANADFAFRYKGVTVQTFLERPEFKRCASEQGSAKLWSCRDQVWDAAFRGKKVDGVAYEPVTLQRAFFQPFYAGQTFGLGQISPLTALGVTDLVNKVSGYDRLTPDRPQAIYRDIMDPDRAIIYIAAIVRDAIDAYAQQGFDISRNPGITATLYNVGQPRRRAAELRSSGRKLPVENYYGWLVNEKLVELRALLGEGT